MSRSATSALLSALGDRSGPAGLPATHARVVAEAARLGVLPVLASVAVRRGEVPELSGALASALGDRRAGLSPVAALLAARYENGRRNRDLEQLEARAVDTLAGVTCIPLKGAALRRHHVWPDPAARPMRDVDLWLPEPGAVERATAILKASGFAEPADHVATLSDHHDEPLLLAGLDGSVELHRHPSSRWASDPGLHYRVMNGERGTELTPESAILHVIVHAQLQDHAYRLRRLPLVPLLDVGYALETGFVTAPGLRAAAAGTPWSRAVEFHLYCAERLRGRRPRGPLGLRWRWWQSTVYLAMPRLAALQQELSLGPGALSRTRMEDREGRRLGGWSLLASRTRFLRRRTPEIWRRITRA